MNVAKLRLGLLFLLASLSVIAQEDAVLEEAEDVAVSLTDQLNSLQQIEAQIDYQTGEVEVASVARLKVPPGFRFVQDNQAEFILKEIWENLNSSSDGMLFSKGASLFGKEGYTINLKYKSSGFVSDEDANKIDYEQLLEEMKQQNERANEARKKRGMFPVKLVDWADAPFYDAKNKRLHWAKEVVYNMGDGPESALNYAIRFLGRKGVLEMNFVGELGQLEQIKKDLPRVLNSLEFNEGWSYEDFDPALDKTADVGVAGLITGKKRDSSVPIGAKDSTQAEEETEASENEASDSFANQINGMWPWFIAFGLLLFVLMFFFGKRNAKKNQSS